MTTGGGVSHPQGRGKTWATSRTWYGPGGAGRRSMPPANRTQCMVAPMVVDPVVRNVVEGRAPSGFRAP